jgi:DNA invertase Pin-like site-specific DNA recombinase
MNAVLYARVSTDKQAEKDLSIPAQLQLMRDYARQHDWIVVEEFLEPGASAKTAERPALQRLLARCRHKGDHLDVVLVHKIDRLARSVYDHATIRALLKQHGIRLASVVENIEDTVSGQLVENIMASIAQFYSANLSEEVKKGMRQKVLNGGWNHRPPRGYVIVQKGGNNIIDVHPTDGPLMRRAFELYSTGWYSIKGLAKRLAEEGLRSKSDGPVPQSHLRNLLASSFYAGTVHWHDLERPGAHPALVSRELFERVQGVLGGHSRDRRITSTIPGFPLRGIAVCASCRGRMTAERHGRFGYYRCSRQTFRRELCGARFCNADRAHASLEGICRGLRLSKERVQEISEAAESLIIERTARAQQRLEHRDQADAAVRQTEMQLTTAFTSGDLAPNDYKARIAELRAKRTALGAEPPAVLSDRLAASVTETLQLASSFLDLYRPLSDRKKQQMVHALFKAVVLDHEGITGYALNPPFDQLMGGSEQEAGLIAEAIVSADAERADNESSLREASPWVDPAAHSGELG